VFRLTFFFFGFDLFSTVLYGGIESDGLCC
jgi:hypothetical protein